MENAVQISKKFFAAIRENEEVANQTANEFGMDIKFHVNEVEGKGVITAFSARYKNSHNAFLVTEVDFKEGYNVLAYLDNKTEVIHEEPFFTTSEGLKPVISFFKDFVKVFEINKTI